MMDTTLQQVAATCAVFNLRKAARAVTSLYDRAFLPASGLRATQVSLLMAIGAAEPVTISVLAQHLVMDRTTLARDLRVLEQQELVRVAPGDDRRTRVVQLTDHGRTQLDTLLPLWEQAQAVLITHGLGAERWQSLRTELHEVVQLAQQA